MAITVQFLISWISVVIPDYKNSVVNYRKAKKDKKPQKIIQLIYDACLKEAQKTHAIEIEPSFHDVKTHQNLKFNNNKKIKGCLR